MDTIYVIDNSMQHAQQLQIIPSTSVQTIQAIPVSQVQQKHYDNPAMINALPVATLQIVQPYYPPQIVQQPADVEPPFRRTPSPHAPLAPPQTASQPSPPSLRTPRRPAKAAAQETKRTRNPESWLSNVRKRKRQSGEDYVDRSGQAHRARRVGKGCGASCRMKCEKLISPDQRKKVFNQFWSLDDQQKWHFYSIYVERFNKARNRSKNNHDESAEPRKKYSYKYFLQNTFGGRVRVCKTFFLSTLDISQKRLYFFYENVITESGLPRASMRGKVGGRGTPETQLQQVRDHIASFERLPPPPECSSASREEFLDSSISIKRMFELYKQVYGTLAVKENVYRKVLKQEFNIKFIKVPVTNSA